MFTMFKVVSNTYRLPLGARYTGDFSRVGSASDCEPCFRFGTVAQVLIHERCGYRHARINVTRSLMSKIKLGTQRNVLSAAIEVA